MSKKYKVAALKKQRDRKLLRNCDIARALDVSESLISKTINGHKQGRDTIRRIAEFLEVPIEEIVGKSA